MRLSKQTMGARTAPPAAGHRREPARSDLTEEGKEAELERHDVRRELVHDHERALREQNGGDRRPGCALAKATDRFGGMWCRGAHEGVYPLGKCVQPPWRSTTAARVQSDREYPQAQHETRCLR